MNTLSINENFLALEDRYSSFNNSKIAILPVPYEATTSYGQGTANGPGAILKASHFVEFFDEELNRELCFDAGIATLPPIEFNGVRDKEALEKIYHNVRELIIEGKYVVTLGGEHTISFAPIKAHLEYFRNLSVLQFDAHSDYREEYEGSKYSHASVMARVSELTRDIVQIGIRAQCREEFEFILQNNMKTFYAHQIRNGEFGNDWDDKVIDALGENVYVTFDVDYFDPSIMPSTGTPEPLGFYWEETMKLLRKLGERRNVVGFDDVELSPKPSIEFPDFYGAKLVYKMLNYFI